MQVIIRRKGLTLAASWDGLAKPSDKKLHYFFRAKPAMDVINAGQFKKIDTVLLSRLIANDNTVGSVSLAPTSRVIMLQGSRGALPRDSVLGSLSTTRIQTAQSPLQAMRLFTTRNTAELTKVITRWVPNVVRYASLANDHPPALVSQSRPLSGASARPTLRLGNKTEYVTGNASQKATASEYRPNIFQSFVIAYETSQDVTLVTAARKRTVPLVAPLPDVALVQPQAAALNSAPASLSTRHLEQLVPLTDPARHTQWTASPRPTHYVLDSQVPDHSPEVLRRDTPEASLMGFTGYELSLNGRYTRTLLDSGVRATTTVTPYGPRGNIAQIDTNGLTSSRFSASGTYSGHPAGAFDGWSLGVDLNQQPVDLTSVAGDEIFQSVWRYNIKGPQWLQVDFGRDIVGINGALLGAPPGLNYLPSAMPKSVTIQASLNGSDWDDIVTFEAAEDDETLQPFEPVTARFIRFFIHSNYGHGYTAVTHVEIYQASEDSTNAV